MKKLKKLALKYGSTVTAISLVFSFWISKSTCRFIFHQPEAPNKFDKFIKEKRNSSWK